MHVFVQLIFSSWLICSFLASANKLKEDDVKDCRSVKETFQLEGINIPTPDAAIFGRLFLQNWLLKLLTYLTLKHFNDIKLLFCMHISTVQRSVIMW